MFNKKERAPHFCTNTTQRRAFAFYAARAPATCDSPGESLPFRGEGDIFRRRPREISGRLPSILSCQLKKLNPRDGQQHVGDQAPSERQVWTGVPRPKFWVQAPLWLPSVLDICSGRLEANGESSRAGRGELSSAKQQGEVLNVFFVGFKEMRPAQETCSH